MRRSSALIFIMLGCIFSTSSLADSKWSLGASAGQSHYDLDNKDIRSLLDFAGIDAKTDEKDTGLKVWGSYQLNEFVVFEAQWLDLGEAGIDLTRNGDQVSVDPSADGLDLAVLLQTPVANETDFFIKFGAFIWDLDVSGANTDSNGTDLSYGLGIRHQWQWLVVRAEYEFFDLDGLKVDLFSVGAGIGF